MVIGDNGIIAKAGIAKDKTNDSQSAEENQLKDYENKIEEYTSRNDSMPESVLLGTITATGNENGVELNLSGYKYIRLVVRDSVMARQTTELIAVSDLNETTYEHYYPSFYWDGNVRFCAEVYIKKDHIFIAALSTGNASGFSNMKIYGMK